MMWHIVAMGYIFTTLMFSIAQPDWARKVIYLVFWTILPTLFFFWVAMTRRRNKIMKWQEQQTHINAQKQPENEP